MGQTRQYREGEEPRVGDVVQLLDGAYGAGVITRIDRDDGMATVERVHASVSGGQIQIGVERVAVSKTRLREIPVYVTGSRGEVDNRDR